MAEAGNGVGRKRGNAAPVVVEGVVTGPVTGPVAGSGTGSGTGPKRRAGCGAGGGAGGSPGPSRKRKGGQTTDVIVPLRARHDGWTPIRQRTFLRALSETGSVRDACKLVGLSKTSAYRLRKMSGDFAGAWDKALSIVAPILEQAAYERGVEGWDEPIYQGGKLVGHKKRYSDAALRMLMQARKAAEAAGMTMPDPATASIEELEGFAKDAARNAGGMFFTRRQQVTCDAKLLQRLDALAARRRREKGLPPEPARSLGELEAQVEAHFPPTWNAD